MNNPIIIVIPKMNIHINPFKSLYRSHNHRHDAFPIKTKKHSRLTRFGRENL
jgi:hypothetical protein